MNNDKYVVIEIPPYINPKKLTKKNNKGYSNIIILTILTLLISTGIIILGMYLNI